MHPLKLFILLILIGAAMYFAAKARDLFNSFSYQMGNRYTKNEVQNSIMKMVGALVIFFIILIFK